MAPPSSIAMPTTVRSPASAPVRASTWPLTSGAALGPSSELSGWPGLDVPSTQANVPLATTSVPNQTSMTAVAPGS